MNGIVIQCRTYSLKSRGIIVMYLSLLWYYSPVVKKYPMQRPNLGALPPVWTIVVRLLWDHWWHDKNLQIIQFALL